MAKIDKALYRPLLIGGIERIYAIILGITLCVFLLYGHLWGRVFGVGFVVVVWFIMGIANSKDYIFFTVLFGYFFQRNYYVAFTTEKKVRKRKDG